MKKSAEQRIIHLAHLFNSSSRWTSFVNECSFHANVRDRSIVVYCSEQHLMPFVNRSSQKSSFLCCLFLLSYSVFLWMMIQDLTFLHFIKQFATLRLSADGLAILPVTHLFWLCVILRSLRKGWHGFVLRSYEFWAVTTIAFCLAKLDIFPSEGNVLLVHCFLLYVFLQQMIDAKTVVKFRNKMKHLLHG